MMTRLVTVIPVYNGESFLKATLESVATQTRQPDCVIIQDNCSTDGTAAIAQDFEKHGFKWHCNKKHVSSIENFNAALRFSKKADVLHVLTADDLIMPDFYARLLEPLLSVKGPALAYSAYEVIGEDGELVKDSDLKNPFPIEPGGLPRIIPHTRFIASQSDLRTICLPAVLMKTNREALSVKFNSDYIQCADAVFYAELAGYCEQIVEVPAALCRYRRHDNSTTSRNRMDPAALIEDEWKAMQKTSMLLGKKGLSAWLWNFRQRCLLAGTSRIMLRESNQLTIAYQAEVVQSTRAITGGIAWYLGNLAVALRDFIRHGCA